MLKNDGLKLWLSISCLAFGKGLSRSKSNVRNARGFLLPEKPHRTHELKPECSLGQCRPGRKEKKKEEKTLSPEVNFVSQNPSRIFN